MKYLEKVRSVDLLDCKKLCFGRDQDINIVQCFQACIFIGMQLAKSSVDNLIKNILISSESSVHNQLTYWVESTSNPAIFQTFDCEANLKAANKEHIQELCNIFQCNISVFIQINKKFLLLHSTKFKKFQQCVKLLYSNRDYRLIISNKNLESTGKTFCVYCNKEGLQDVMIEELQQRFINYFWGRPNWPSGPLILDP